MPFIFIYGSTPLLSELSVLINKAIVRREQQSLRNHGFQTMRQNAVRILHEVTQTVPNNRSDQSSRDSGPKSDLSLTKINESIGYHVMQNLYRWYASLTDEEKSTLFTTTEENNLATTVVMNENINSSSNKLAPNDKNNFYKLLYRLEHAYCLALPFGTDQQNPFLHSHSSSSSSLPVNTTIQHNDLTVICTYLSDILQEIQNSPATNDAKTIKTRSLIYQQYYTAAITLRKRYEIEYLSPNPWKGTNRVITYGIQKSYSLAFEREQKFIQQLRTMISSSSSSDASMPTFSAPLSTSFALSFLSLLEPRRPGFAISAVLNKKPRVPVEKGEEDCPSCLSAIGGGMDEIDNNDTWKCILRELEEEGCLNIHGLVHNYSSFRYEPGSSTLPSPVTLPLSGIMNDVTNISSLASIRVPFFGIDEDYVIGKDVRYYFRLPENCQFILPDNEDTVYLSWKTT